MVIWRGGGGGRLGKGREFDKRRPPVVGTFNYHQVLGVRTFEFPSMTDDILDWKLLTTWSPVGYQSHYKGYW